MPDVNTDLLWHHILTAGTLTALEKRYLEQLIEQDRKEHENHDRKQCEALCKG